MACKRITISLTEEQYDNFKAILPIDGNLSEIAADMINMFVEACEEYNDEFILDSICNNGTDRNTA